MPEIILASACLVLLSPSSGQVVTGQSPSLSPGGLQVCFNFILACCDLLLAGMLSLAHTGAMAKQC